MTVSPQGLDGQSADLELFLVLNNVVDLGNAGISSIDGKARLLGDQLNISTGMVPVMVSAKDGSELGSQMLDDVQQFLRFNGIHNCTL